MSKYSPRAQATIGETLHRFKQGKLKSSSGQKVSSKQQALAIGISEARSKHQKVPDKSDD